MNQDTRPVSPFKEQGISLNLNQPAAEFFSLGRVDYKNAVYSLYHWVCSTQTFIRLRGLVKHENYALLRRSLVGCGVSETPLPSTFLNVLLLSLLIAVYSNTGFGIAGSVLAMKLAYSAIDVRIVRRSALEP